MTQRREMLKGSHFGIYKIFCVESARDVRLLVEIQSQPTSRRVGKAGAAAGSCPDLPRDLKEDLQPDLNLPGRKRVVDNAKRRAVYIVSIEDSQLVVCTRGRRLRQHRKVRAVEQVENIESELNPRIFGDRQPETLSDAHVDSGVPGSAHR